MLGRCEQDLAMKAKMDRVKALKSWRAYDQTRGNVGGAKLALVAWTQRVCAALSVARSR